MKQNHKHTIGLLDVAREKKHHKVIVIYDQQDYLFDLKLTLPCLVTRVSEGWVT